jgi:hypothetical protein
VGRESGEVGRKMGQRLVGKLAIPEYLAHWGSGERATLFNTREVFSLGMKWASGGGATSWNAATTTPEHCVSGAGGVRG